MSSKKLKPVVEFSTGQTVTIDELLKNDPDALAGLKEIREWMKANPAMFQFPEEKKTQGQKKMKQLLQDARRNSVFGKRLGKIIEAGPSYDPRELEILYSKYRWFLVQIDEFQKKFLKKDKAHKLKVALSREYGIDPILLDRLLSAYRNERMEGWDFSEETSSDMVLIDDLSEIQKPQDIHNFHLKTVDQTEQEVYPVSLKVHRFASKRDVLDFVEKNWKQVQPFLKEKRIKSRKLPREVLDFIWKHRGKKAKEIASLITDRFPEQHLVYFEISKILNDEKNRRNTEKL